MLVYFWAIHSLTKLFKSMLKCSRLLCLLILNMIVMTGMGEARSISPECNDWGWEKLMCRKYHLQKLLATVISYML